MKNVALSSIAKGVAGLLVLSMLFMIAEPALGTAATTSQFTVSETVSPEVSFKTPASNVTLSPSLGGITGGQADGGTQVVVTTNDHSGYQMTLTSSSSVGMIGNSSSTNSIAAMPNSNTASFSLDGGSVAANTAAFGYTIEASTTADLATTFKDNASVCGGAGTLDTANKCWLNASTTAVTLVNSNYFTQASGSTTTLKFRVVIQPNPVPVIPDDTYVSTSTLTVTAK